MSCAIRTDDSMYCWGQNDLGQLLDAMSVFHCWGQGDVGQLGLGDMINRPNLTPICW